MSNSVTISEEEYLELLEDSDMLQALISAGVDNWDGYEQALELLDEMNEALESSSEEVVDSLVEAAIKSVEETKTVH